MNSEKTQVNWTQEQTADLVNAYKDEKDTAVLAARFGRTQRSIIAKLVTEKAYEKAETAKTKGATKAQLIASIEEVLNLPAGILTSLDKGSKEALLAMQAAVEALNEAANSPG